MKRQKLIGIIASVALAAVGTGLLVTYVRSAEDRALRGEKTVRVVVASDTIPKGTKAEDLVGKVKTEQVPTKVVADGSISDLGSIAGQVSVVDLFAGEQLVQSRFATGRSGKATVPPGSLQVTVALDAVRVLGGQVREGDSVGVLASFEEPETTRLILHKVPVTNVRTAQGVPVTAGVNGTAPTGVLMVTLALDTPSVERVVFAAEHGRLWLSWEPEDANEGGSTVQTRAGVNL